MDRLTELWQTLEKTPGVTRVQKLGKWAIAFRYEGTQHSVYVHQQNESMALFRLGDRIGTFNEIPDVIGNLKAVPV